ncbi:unnamed protein product [Parajaminaea phylloscopi]
MSPRKRQRREGEGEGEGECAGDGHLLRAEVQLETDLSAVIRAPATGAWARSVAHYERSRLRSRSLQHVKAVQDARQCLKLFPSEPKVRASLSSEWCPLAAARLTDRSPCTDPASLLSVADGLLEQFLLRAVVTLDAAGHREAAVQALEVVSRTGMGSLEDGLEPVLRQATLSLRPFDLLPNEIVAHILTCVPRKTSRNATPLTVAQVCQRWRQIAFRTPLLWQDTHIFLPEREKFSQDFIVSPLQEDHAETRFRSNIGPSLSDPSCLNVLEFCGRLSGHSMKRIQIGFHNGGFTRLSQCLDLAMQSRSTLTHLTIDLTTYEPMPDFSRQRPLCLTVTEILQLILRAPRLVDVRIVIPRDAIFDLEYISAELAEMTSLLSEHRRRPFENFVWAVADSYNDPRARPLLDTVSRLPSEGSLGDIWTEQLRTLRRGHFSLRPHRGWAELNFRALEECAQTLEDLTISYWSLFQWVFWHKGPELVFPKLRRLVLCDPDCPEELPVLPQRCMPALTEVHGRIQQIAPLLTSQIETTTIMVSESSEGATTRNRSAAVCAALSKLDNVVSLTLSPYAPEHHPCHVDVVEALTPSLTSTTLQRVGAVDTPMLASLPGVLCPKLQHFGLVAEDWYTGAAVQRLLRPEQRTARVTEPPHRDLWESLPSLSSAILAMQRERMLLGGGRPLSEVQAARRSNKGRSESQPARPSPFSRGGQADPTPSRVANGTGADDRRRTDEPACKALNTVAIRNFYVSPELWSAMARVGQPGSSQSEGTEQVSVGPGESDSAGTGHLDTPHRSIFDVLPDPDLMSRLLRRPGGKNAGRKMHAWS